MNRHLARHPQHLARNRRTAASALASFANRPLPPDYFLIDRSRVVIGVTKPSSWQFGDWFWNETATGAAVYALRELLQTQQDERLWLIVSNFMVPSARAHTG